MDALHVAMAAQLGAEMATFDADQAAAAKAEGLTVHTDKP
jgi:predicted nucleic acid-binding protein